MGAVMGVGGGGGGGGVGGCEVVSRRFIDMMLILFVVVHTSILTLL